MIPRMKQTWRWYGPNDPVSLKDICQAGAKGIVSALHEVPNGEVWQMSDIKKRNKIIEKSGLTWDVVESLPVHEKIKTRTDNFKNLIENYKLSLTNLANCGVKIVCYNFMPVLDWTRTKLDMNYKDGSYALEFNFDALRAFDLFILKRDGSKNDYSDEEFLKAETYYKLLSNDQKNKLGDNILKGLPGSEVGYSLEAFREILKTYNNINSDQLKKNLVFF